MRPTILVVDDDPAILFSISGFFKKTNYKVHTAPNLKEGREIIKKDFIDAIVLDMQLPDGNGIQWIPLLRKKYPALAIIMITGAGDIPLAVEAMQKGADHFLTKPLNLTELEIFLKKSLELSNLRKNTINEKRLKKNISPFWGETDVMRHVRKLANIAAGSDSPVLLMGETGTGKGVLAHWIHEHSQQSQSSFVEINCTSLKGELLASELFGHKKGAFTSAVEDKQGLIEVAHGGTLFLDEIGDLDLEIQTQLLKVIEEKQFRRLGDIETRKSNFRLLCATNRDLVQEVEEKHFRQDLFYRINVFPIEIPPLRERQKDIESLVSYFLSQLGSNNKKISQSLKKILDKYNWPGNIREMRNVLERAHLLSNGEELKYEHFPGLDLFLSHNIKPTDIYNLEYMEARHISEILNQCGQDTQNAARMLGISRASLYRKIQKYQLK